MTTIEIPLNRVEGDLEVRLQLEGGAVSEAWCSGTMYRGFERILMGRGALDGLVITPRICGICSTSHLIVAALALEHIGGVMPPPNAVRVRNVALMAEQLQSDMRQAFLMFSADFVNPRYRDEPLFAEAHRRFEPLVGCTSIEVIRETKKILEIVALVGGQWPHSSFVVPGGVASVPTVSDLLQCRLLLARFRSFYERRVLGCSIQRWRELTSAKDLWRWLDGDVSHRDSELGLFIRLCRALGLQQTGRGPDRYLSFGSFILPPGTAVQGDHSTLLPSGFACDGAVEPFRQEEICEHTSCSWFNDGDHVRHPSEGETIPYASGHEGRRYSWAKAPRYRGRSAETGPLAEAVIAGDPLIGDLLRADGSSAFVRQLARLVRPTIVLPAMEAWLSEIDGDDSFYRSQGRIRQGDGCGLTMAPRGALGHWVSIRDSRIERYQVISPTTWNCSPRDESGQPGPMEQALLNTPVLEPDNPIEVGHVVRSFDPCLVCTVHSLGAGGSARGRALV